jgi:uncharacterized protein
VDQEVVLSQIVERLVRAIEPRRILLFGSRSTGESRTESDFDLLVVWRDENPPAFRSAEVRKVLSGIRVSLDITVVTLSELERFRDRRFHIVGIAAAEGRVLHAA